ncbi:hypothetical protein BDN72DRAFT_65468 [Pluteus cervinus]|uniref:Uncharacterized protein n=1 Tax=Pluteus cervinus TaxID=181527 RepID=A0ACD3AS11_9AGAR|nr:hypothetical protein BDN72DRAFT_65468 [Pluteus cervinus]
MPQNYFHDMMAPSRAAQRKRRLEDIEREQRREEIAALKMTEEQREALQRSFESVKVEFSDLDGQKWSQSILRTRSQQTYLNALKARFSAEGVSPSSSHTGFAILSKTELESFSPEETIRASGKLRKPIFDLSTSTRNSSSVSNTKSRGRGSVRHSVLGLFAEDSKPDTVKVQGVDCDVGAGFSKGSPVIADDFLCLLELLNLKGMEQGVGLL